MRLGKHVAFLGPDRPLELRENEVKDPAAGCVLAQVDLAGVCGTDAHRLRGDLPSPAFAISLGHESVGTVAEIGAGVFTDAAGEELKIGDRIYWAVIGPCGHCYACTVLDDQPQCSSKPWPVSADVPNAAGFREFATLSQNMSVFRIPDDTPSTAVVAFGCAMPTALAGFRRIGPIAPATTVLVQGAGPVGLACTMLAGLTSAKQVITIGAPDNRLRAAERLGATTTLSLEIPPKERLEMVRELTHGRGADIVIEAAGHVSAFVEGIDLIASHGRYLVLGLYSGTTEVPFNPVRLNNANLTLVGSFGSHAGDYLTTIKLAQQHHDDLGLAELITHRFGLADTRAAIECVASGEAIKAVIEPRAQATLIRQEATDGDS